MPQTSFNIFVSSLSKKVPLVKALRRALDKLENTYSFDKKTQIIGGDTNPHCIGRYFVDEFWEMPRLSELQIGEFIEYCRARSIRAIIPTRDGELPYYSSNKEKFAAFEIYPMVTNEMQLAHCLDKWLFAQTLQILGLPIIPTEESIHSLHISDTYVVKERFGAGSRSLGLKLSKEEAIAHAKLLSFPIFQPFIEGEEYSVDLFLECNGKTKGVIARKRNVVVDGESQITTTCSFPELEELCVKAAEALELSGHVIFQVLHKKGASQYPFALIECNPRFGGASTLSLSAGLDSFYWFFLEVLQADLKDHLFIKSPHILKLVRHPEDAIFEL